MANIVSAKKRARQSLVRKERNQRMKSAVRQLERKLKAAIVAKDKNEAETLLKDYSSAIDKASQKGKFHPRTAARKVSRLTISLNKTLSA